MWLDNGWLIPYPEKELKELIPLMAVVQDNKNKVHSVMDFIELNKYINPFMAAADVYSQKLKEW